MEISNNLSASNADINTDSFHIHAAIIGVHKCATTSLWKALAQHPGITTHHTGQLIPPYIGSLETNEFKDIDCFANWLDPDKRGKRNLVRDTTLYDDLESLERLCKLYPAMKIIVCVRNPSERSYSAFVHAKNRGFELTYDTIESVAEAHDAGTLKLRSPPLLNYIDQSFYHKKISGISKLIDNRNIHIVSVEKLQNDFNLSCNNIIKFLGLPAFSVEKIEANKSSKTKSKVLNRILKSDSFIKVVARSVLGSRVRTKISHRLHSLNLSETNKDQLKETTRQHLDSLFLSDWNEFLHLTTNRMSTDLHIQIPTN